MVEPTWRHPLRGTTTNNVPNAPRADAATLASLEIVALCPNPEKVVGQHRRELPAVVAGIIAEVPGAEVELELLTGEDGMVAAALTAAAGAFGRVRRPSR